MKTLTANEEKMIQNLATNHYSDELGDPIWCWAWDCGMNAAFCKKESASGIMSSLAQKGIVVKNEDGKDSTIRLTEEGIKIAEILTA